MYYYFSASLPELKPGEAPPITPEEFDAEAQMHLGARHYAQLTASPEDDDAPPEPRVYREMRRFETALRTRIALRRAEKLGVPLEVAEPEEFYTEIDAALTAIAALNPAERERAIDLIRWKKLEEIAQNHGFDFDHVCAYRSQLLIAEKYRGRDTAEGRAHFAAALKQIATKEDDI